MFQKTLTNFWYQNSIRWKKNTYEPRSKVIETNHFRDTLENTEGAIKKWTIQRNWQHRVHQMKIIWKQNPRKCRCSNNKGVMFGKDKAKYDKRSCG